MKTNLKAYFCRECYWIHLDTHNVPQLFKLCPKCLGECKQFESEFHRDFNEKLLITQNVWIGRQLEGLEGEQREKRRRELEIQLKKEVLEKI